MPTPPGNSAVVELDTLDSKQASAPASRQTRAKMAPDSVRLERGVDPGDSTDCWGFSDREDESLYRKFFLLQRSRVKRSLAVLALLHCACVVTFDCVAFTSESVMRVATVLVLAALQTPLALPLRVWEGRSPCFPWLLRLLWCALAIQVLFAAATAPPRVQPPEHLGWVGLLLYATFLTLPSGGLAWPLGMAVLVGLTHAVVVGLASGNALPPVTLLANQMGANVFLYACALVVGAASFLATQRRQRAAFLGFKSSVRVNARIEKEYKQQERLLLSVLPKHVADEMLRDHGAVIDSQFRKIYMSRHENVSILFADIVGFTAISSTCTATQLVRMLNELFATFDKLAERYQQRRIKILGDCYYCVCGVPEPRPDHAVLCVYMGLAMVDVIRTVREKTSKDVNMRVGVHTGGVLGGVLGQRQWQYDVLGRNVELANKMESAGLPGRVHISEATRGFLQGQFELEEGRAGERDDFLRLHGHKTWLVKAVKKQHQVEQQASPDDRASSPGSVLDNESSSPPNDSKENEAPSGPAPYLFDITEVTTSRSERKKRLLQTRFQHTLVNTEHISQFLQRLSGATLRFKDAEVEARYRARRGHIGPLSLGILGVTCLTCFAAKITVLPRTLTGILAFVVCLLLLLLMTLVSMATQYVQSYPDCMIKFARWLDSGHVTRLLWLLSGCGVLMISEVLSMVPCVNAPQPAFNVTSQPLPTADPQCYYAAYFAHAGSAVLVAVERVGRSDQGLHLLLLLLTAALYSLLFLLPTSALLDNYDHAVFQGSTVLASKYQLSASLFAQALFLFFLSRQLEQTERQMFWWREKTIKEEQEALQLRRKNEALLYNLLPAHVARHFIGRNKHHEELYNHAFEEVGVLFAACPNFSSFYNESAVNNNGLECLRFLNEIISDYDELLQQTRFASIHKIKTVGSTYMAASGMTAQVSLAKDAAPAERWRHLDDLVQFALAMKAALETINEQSFNDFVLRIGLNHGPVTAGVIGATRPHYDIWGNTVNVASRMESTGLAGKIQVVEETKEILQLYGYVFEKRGLIRVKGKGELMTYYLVNKLPPPELDDAIPNQVLG